MQPLRYSIISSDPSIIDNRWNVENNNKTDKQTISTPDNLNITNNLNITDYSNITDNSDESMLGISNLDIGIQIHHTQSTRCNINRWLVKEYLFGTNYTPNCLGPSQLPWSYSNDCDHYKTNDIYTHGIIC